MALLARKGKGSPNYCWHVLLRRIPHVRYMGQQHHKFDPDNTEASFAHVSTEELFRAMFIFDLCSRPRLIKFGRAMLEKAASPTGALGKTLARPVLHAFQTQIFPHFCAGEVLADCAEAHAKWARARVKIMIDHSKEEDESPASHEHNLNEKVALLRNIRSAIGDDVMFVPVKVTALASPLMLESVTKAIASRPDWVSTPTDIQHDRRLGASEQQQLEKAIDNISRLAEEGARLGFRLLLDAEQTHRQPAIDHMAMAVMRRINRQGEPIVYNTYQCYLSDARARLERDLNACQSNHVTFAAKMVRGAYTSTERGRASNGHVISHMHGSKAETDQAYDAAIALMLREIHAYPHSAAVVIATHNKTSLLHATSLIEDLQLPRNHRGIHFGQIMGMCDHVSAALGLAGYNAHKLLLFGTFRDLFPWLLRRLDENSDILGAMTTERHLISKELRRREMARRSRK